MLICGAQDNSFLALLPCLPQLRQTLFILEKAGLFGTQAGEVYQVGPARRPG